MTTSREVPRAGMFRVAIDPMYLPPATDEVGPNRFDDPRARTQERFVVRYGATSLRGCLLELLDWARPNQEAAELEASVASDLPEPVQEQGIALGRYLAGRQVGVIKPARRIRVPSIDDPVVQAELDREPAVRALLAGPDARRALASASATDPPHLDNAAIRLSSPLGREITRYCSLALWDRGEAGVHYRSRHDDAEDCWALYDRVQVIEVSNNPLSPINPDHRGVLRTVAAMWDLELPAEWSD